MNYLIPLTIHACLCRVRMEGEKEGGQTLSSAEPKVGPGWVRDRLKMFLCDLKLKLRDFEAVNDLEEERLATLFDVLRRNKIYEEQGNK